MTHPDKTAVGALVKRLRAEEARTIRLFDFVVAERDKREFGPAGFTLLNSIKHAISGRDPVLPDAADALTAQAAEIANLRATNMALIDAVARLTGERAELALQLLARDGQSADRANDTFAAGLEAAADDWSELIAEAIAEADKAMRKFPQPNYVISKVAEEAGETVKAAIHCAEGRETFENLRGEMKQTIAMLYRLWIEGDEVHGLSPVIDALRAPKEAER